MKLTLIEVLLHILEAFIAIWCIDLFIEIPEASRLIYSIPIVVCTWLIVNSILYKRLEFFPLFLPTCPHCLKKESYSIISSSGDVTESQCQGCEGKFSVRWKGKRNDSEGVTELICKNQYLGFYKTVKIKKNS